ncbi:7-deoxyloganetin glucosyltransferase-like [Iris pallida]|uniref:7-deoxyloganetin glucosyltransferase-like n=1 Tax=Iris pallida TaxID=29817 RepID=A0AAX6FF84_IRIPA|nr:7-deoxyloganetin glucosyltransferase-like [Iris pallida]
MVQNASAGMPSSSATSSAKLISQLYTTQVTPGGPPPPPPRRAKISLNGAEQLAAYATQPFETCCFFLLLLRDVGGTATPSGMTSYPKSSSPARASGPPEERRMDRWLDRVWTKVT